MTVIADKINDAYNIPYFLNNVKSMGQGGGFYFVIMN